MNEKSVTSEDELKKLLVEGKITEDEFRQLKHAMLAGQSQQSEKEDCSNTMSDGELRLRKKLLIYSFVTSLIGLPVSLILGLPYVWGLSIAGIIVGLYKMKRYGVIK